MVAPISMSISSLEGSWSLDKELSDDPDAILKLQGVVWLVRKTIRATPLRLVLSPQPEQSENSEFMHFVMQQVLPGGMSGTTENRILDWIERPYKDSVFGDVIARNRLIDAVLDADGIERPNLDLQSVFLQASHTDGVKGFLRDVTPSISVPGGKEDHRCRFMHDFVRNEREGWTAEQVWGFYFETSQRCLKRRVVVVKDGKYETAVFVYKFVE